MIPHKTLSKDKEIVSTGLVFGNVSRRCRRRLFFGTLFGVVGLALTSKIDAPLFNVYEVNRNNRFILMKKKKISTNIISFL